jgi:hypothetical protein
VELPVITAGSWLGILGSTALMLAAFVANKYVIPFLQAGQRQKVAEFVAAIAEDIIDELRQKYPDKEWLTHLDEAIDSLVSICGISPDIAERAIRATAARK